MEIPVSELFPLFSPEGERDWVPGWDYHNIMGTTELSEDYVFLTKSHDHGMADAVWVVKKYDCDARLVEFYRVEPGVKVGLVRVKCTELGTRRTEVKVTYRYIALSQRGEDFISGFTADAYEEFIGEWQELLTKYFASSG
jgi:hypothetical protein